MDRVECVVVGAGVVGLAVARALALEGREVVVLEREGRVGSHTSSRNSEVIHAGIYYPRDSVKARLCLRGRALLYAYCAARGVAHRRLGKIIVATGPEQGRRSPASPRRPRRTASTTSARSRRPGSPGWSRTSAASPASSRPRPG